MFQIGAVRSSFSPSVCLDIVLQPTGSLVFSKFWDGPSNLYEVVCDRARFFGETKFSLLNKGLLISSYIVL